MKFHESVLVLKERINKLTLRSILFPGDIGTIKARDTQTSKYYLYIQQKGRCCFCQERMYADSSTGTSGLRATIEHVVCRSKGGPDKITNYTLSCNLCNNRRGDQEYDKFSKRVASFGRPASKVSRADRITIRKTSRKRELALRFQTDGSYRLKVIAAVRQNPSRANIILKNYDVSLQDLRIEV